MKATQRDFAGLAQRVAGQARVFFFCGDEASAGDAAARIFDLLLDPGERIEFTGAELKRDPVRLGDEARSTSLFGGTRHIWIRVQGDEAHDALSILLEGEAEPCPVLVVATGATDKSRTAKLLAPRPDALVAMFYPPDLAAVSGSVRAMANGAGLKMGSDLAERIARAAGLDTRLARAEVEKLALYMDATAQTPRAVTVADLDAVAARTEDDDFGPLVDAVLGGRKAQLAGELKRFRDQAINPVGLLLAIERRVAQLAALNARLGEQADIAAFIKTEVDARRIFWKDQAVLGAQLRIWHGPRLARLGARLVETHRILMKNNQDSELLLSQVMTQITQIASRS
ncbi:DNA polymerase III subunit delta [Novosphingobium sp. 9]|uniref:DNA polymerase III subunit delta n=1 Tax=Novosphingobium sp. 9 TaxID=2025349 RepID=UPI0021B51E46|nr:DNA polymerase III subunit delta [Novosphingobium sp. 9]